MSAAPALAQGLPSEPMLRIETGAHLSTIRDLAVRSDGAVVATVADDKTVRLWNAHTGERLESVRVPSDQGQEGVLNAVAYWPGESHLLVSGITGASYFVDSSGRPLNYLYFLSFSSGLRKFQGVQPGGVINAIAVYRRTGTRRTFLATAHSQNPRGVVVLDERMKRVLRDDLGAPTTWVQFDAEGDLVAVAENGLVRLYADGFHTARDWRAPSGRPAQARFSPNGRWLAVGYVDVGRVDLIRTATMKRVASLAGRRADTVARFLNAVTWTRGRSGPELWASGGLIGPNRRIAVRRWADIARPDDFVDIPVSSDAVTRLATTPDGDVLFATGGPSWGRIDAGTSTVSFTVTSPKADNREIFDDLFRVAKDASVVDFRFRTAKGDRNLRFDAAAMRLTVAPAVAPDMVGPVVPGGLSDWKDSKTPRLGKRRVRLRAKRDTVRSVAALADGRFVLGSDFTLTLYDPKGRPLASKVVLSSASGVVVSGDGKRLVAALRDGTIRWYSLRPGRELEEIAALFIHADGRRWLLWSPDGHFAHSDRGGQELAGYIVNRGFKSAADWIDFSQLYRRFYDFDLMRLRVGFVAPRNAVTAAATPSVKEAVSAAPVVKLVRFCAVDAAGKDRACYAANAARRGLSRRKKPGEPANAAVLPEGIDTVRLVYEMTPGTGKITRHDVFLNGHTTGQTTRGLKRLAAAKAGAAAALTAERVLTLPAGENEVYVRAYDESGVFGKSPPLRIVMTEPRREKRPDLYVIAVGVDVYRSDIPKLAFARRDAQAVAEKLAEVPPEEYENVHVTTLLDEKATHETLHAAFAQVAKKMTSHDALIVYLAGHGVVDEAGVYRFVSQDVPSWAAIPSDAIDQSELAEMIGSVRAANTLVMIDTCHSGAYPADTPGELGNETGFFILAASSTREEALDGYDTKNGVFAYAVLHALSGGAKDFRNVVTVTGLGEYVHYRVPRLASKKGFRQTAQFRSAGGRLAGFVVAAPATAQ